jgi:hypothetical protein
MTDHSEMKLSPNKDVFEVNVNQLKHPDSDGKKTFRPFTA